MKDVKIKVTEAIRCLGIPASLRGYNQVRDGIMMMIEDPTVVDQITKVLYPTIAEKYSTTPSRVERNIRHAIEVAFERGDLDYIHQVFSSTVSNKRGKPTNTEFMALIADNIRLEVELNG